MPMPMMAPLSCSWRIFGIPEGWTADYADCTDKNMRMAGTRRRVDHLSRLLPYPCHPRNPRLIFSFLPGSTLFDLDQVGHEHLVGVTERFEKNEIKRADHDEKNSAGDEVMGADAFPARRERDQSERRQ